MSMGLVLEGGAMRGIFTAGVLDVLMENGFVFDGVIGVSAGACFGCNYVSNQIGRTIRYNIKYAKDERYCSVRSLLQTGDMYGADFCYHKLPEELDIFDYETFRTSDTKFYIVATNVSTGAPVYHQLDEMNYKSLEWVRASSSMPVVSRIVEIDGSKYMDGGVTDSIPLRAFEGMGYQTNVTILTQPRAYTKKPNKMMPIIKRMYKQYPRFIHANEVRHIAYSEQRRYVFESEKTGNNFVICPKMPLPIGRICHNPDTIREVYDIGRHEALEMLPALERFWDRNNGRKNRMV